jgi:hypothetical protein
MIEPLVVISAKAGTQPRQENWAPASAGVTEGAR